MFSILPKFSNKILLVVSKLLKTGLREEGRFVRQMTVTASDIGLWNWKSNLVVCEARGLLSAVQLPCNPLHFTFCWPASRYIQWRKHQLDAQFIFSIVRQTPLHVSGLSIPINRRYNRIYTTFGIYYCS
jgi:hypothetical protein